MGVSKHRIGKIVNQYKLPHKAGFGRIDCRHEDEETNGHRIHILDSRYRFLQGHSIALACRTYEAQGRKFDRIASKRQHNC